MEKLLNKLKYRSWHRGTKEADLILGKFFDKTHNCMSKDDLKNYDIFLSLANDNDLVLIVKGEKQWPANYPIKIVNLLEKYIISENLR